MVILSNQRNLSVTKMNVTCPRQLLSISRASRDPLAQDLDSNAYLLNSLCITQCTLKLATDAIFI